MNKYIKSMADGEIDALQEQVRLHTFIRDILAPAMPSHDNNTGFRVSAWLEGKNRYVCTLHMEFHNPDNLTRGFRLEYKFCACPGEKHLKSGDVPYVNINPRDIVVSPFDYSYRHKADEEFKLMMTFANEFNKKFSQEFIKLAKYYSRSFDASMKLANACASISSFAELQDLTKMAARELEKIAIAKDTKSRKKPELKISVSS